MRFLVGKNPSQKMLLKVCWHLLFLLLILATSPWGLSKSWGAGVPTLDIDHSGPSLCCLLLRTLIVPAPTCPISPSVFFHPASVQDHPPTRESLVSVPSYRKIYVTLPYLNLHHQIPTLPLFPRPHHSCQITVSAAPTLLPKFLMVLF